jgi:hypothetical protein
MHQGVPQADMDFAEAIYEDREERMRHVAGMM